VKIAYLSLGSNVGHREEMLQRAVDLLHRRDLRILRLSSVYETEPMELRNQRWFLNLVAEVETDLFPMQLLSRVGKIEQQLGRKRQISKGPRTIDIDILFYGNAVINSARLNIPHPRLGERRFVLAPMVELAPEYRHPVNRRTMRDLLPATAGQGVRKVAFAPVVPTITTPD
jgi:2-amino-4-hydroxy-6-hydroxymethyldihydropteridine diphosphokinase